MLRPALNYLCESLGQCFGHNCRRHRRRDSPRRSSRSALPAQSCSSCHRCSDSPTISWPDLPLTKMVPGMPRLSATPQFACTCRYLGKDLSHGNAPDPFVFPSMETFLLILVLSVEFARRSTNN